MPLEDLIAIPVWTWPSPDAPACVHATLAELTGLPTGGSPSQGVHPADRPAWREMVMRAGRLGQAEGRFRWSLASGGWSWRREVVRSQGGAVVGTVLPDTDRVWSSSAPGGTGHDQFRVSLSHGLRTPAVALQGLSQQLAEHVHDAQGIEMVRSLQGVSERFTNLLDHLGQLERLGDDSLPWKARPVELHALIADVVGLVTPMARTRGLPIDLSLDLDPRAPEVDPSWLRQVLRELLTNALQFTEKGRISVRARSQVVGFTYLLEVDVADTGPGIAPEFLPQLFEPFQVADPYRPHTVGLGLTLARALCEGMGGTLAVSSMQGLGATFKVRMSLPLGENPEGDNECSDAPLQLRVLLADDQPLVRRAMARQLERLGCTVAVAEDGRGAVELAHLKVFDLVLLDLNMPVLDGIGAARALRSMGGWCATVPILGFTADAERALAARAVFDEVLAKPLPTERLSLALREAVRGRWRSARDGSPERSSRKSED